MPPKLAIIAGGGDLPGKLINHLINTKQDFYVVGIIGHVKTDLLINVRHSLIRIGQAGLGIKLLKREEITDIIMIGNVKLPSLLNLRPDLRTFIFFLRVIIKSAFKFIGDDKILSNAALELEREGFKIVGIDDVLTDIIAPAGILGSISMNKKFTEDVRIGIDAALKLGRLDKGQAVIVKSGKVVMSEDRGGTAQLINRAKMLSNSNNAILIKLKKPGQDTRLDLPTIGIETVKQAFDANLVGIVIQAGATIIVERNAMIDQANKSGLFINSIEVDEL
jgi:DUF1009 family protein